MAYIDVRGVYPSYVTNQYSVSLENMIRELHIPESNWRNISVYEAETYLLTNVKFYSAEQGK